MIVCTEEEYLQSKGFGMSALGEFAMHRLPGLSHGARKRDALAAIQKAKDELWQRKRDELREEYRAMVYNGAVRTPSRLERLTVIAQGHPDREDVKAAKRLLAKMEGNTP